MDPTKFVNEAYAELKKSSWLPRKQAMASTMVVVILVAIMSAYVKVVDVVLSMVLGALFGR